MASAHISLAVVQLHGHTLVLWDAGKHSLPMCVQEEKGKGWVLNEGGCQVVEQTGLLKPWTHTRTDAICWERSLQSGCTSPSRPCSRASLPFLAAWQPLRWRQGSCRGEEVCGRRGTGAAQGGAQLEDGRLDQELKSRSFLD